jgi:hypothetical protein
MSTLNKYPFDETGKASTNRVVAEPHDVGGVKNKVIVPNHAPFYSIGLVLQTKSGVVLEPGRDYKTLYLYNEVVEVTGLPAFSALAITNELIAGEVLVTYQAVGGDYDGVASAIIDVVNNLEQVSLEVTWDDIKYKPEEYNPIQHKHHSSDLTGMKETVEAVNRVEQAIRDQQLAGLDSKVSKVGHTKLIVDEGGIDTVNHTGPIYLTFGRSTTGDARFSLDIELFDETGTSGLNITAKEGDTSFSSVIYNSSGATTFSIPVALYSVTPTSNILVVGADDQVWGDGFLHVESITVKALDTSPYTHDWVWTLATGVETFPVRSLPTSTADQTAFDIGNLKVSVLGLADLINLHINDTDNPHSVTKDQVSLGLVENFAASSDYTDDSETLYATAKSVDELENATTEQIAQASIDLTTAIETSLDRGITF